MVLVPAVTELKLSLGTLIFMFKGKGKHEGGGLNTISGQSMALRVPEQTRDMFIQR